MATRITGVYSEEQRADIIAHVIAEVASGRPVSRVLKEDEGMPASSQFWRWVYVDGTPELQSKVARARGDGQEALLDEIVPIADEKLPADPDKARAAVAHRKLRIETRVRSAQMLKPKTYSPKLDITSDGEQINFASQLERARKLAQDGTDAPSE